jgi:hypothetical protein
MRSSRTIATLVCAALAAQAPFQFSFAGPISGVPLPHTPPPIPDSPSAPPSLSQTPPPDTFRCERDFTYKDRTYSCDSNVRQDGENLRPILAPVPGAISELNIYQRNRRNLRNAAYMGSLGLLISLVGIVISRPPILDGDIRPGGYALIGGAALTTASFSYALGLAWANESHLEGAVTAFNRAQPATPVALVSKQSFQQRYFKPHYITAIGGALMLAGVAISHPPIDGGNFSTGGYLLMAGAVTTFVSVFYGLGALGSGGRPAAAPAVGLSIGDPASGRLGQFQLSTRLTF